MSFECSGCGGMPRGANNPCRVCGESSAGLRIERAMIDMRNVVKGNLKQCCRELLLWSDTSILCDGQVRRAATALCEIGIGHYGMCLNIVKAEVAEQAMRHIADGDK